MKRFGLLAGTALLLTSAIAVAQQGPESLLPPGFDKPAARPAAKPAAAPPAARPAAPAPKIVAAPVAAAAPTPGAVAEPQAAGPVAIPSNLPSLDKIESMSPDELAALLGNRPHADMPAGARRAMSHVGIIDEGEGGLPARTLAHQNASLVRAVMAGNNGQIISRWGHILLRRALASRLDAPAGMDPAEFAALRTALLMRMGEGAAARGLAQDVDAANYNPALTQAALDAYVATGDFTGACPVVGYQGGARKDRPWQAMQAICEAFSSGGTRGMQRLDRISTGDGLERIDLLLAQRYAGAAGRAQRAVNIEWNGVQGMTPWRYSMALSLGLTPPDKLLSDMPAALHYIAATSPAAPLTVRAASADYAGAAGILSSAAMVDLYGQIYSSGGSGDWTDLATELQSAYLATSPADRLAAILQVWGKEGAPTYYGRQVLTAYAAARLPADSGWADDAPGLIASMLAAGLDANAMRWGPIVPEGTAGWGMLVLAQPDRTTPVGNGQIDSFHGNDKSDEKRKTQFLIAGLAGLGRLQGNGAELAAKYEFTLDRPSRWTATIDKAAEVGNPTLVALLAGVGMQGSGWDKMTPRNLYHIVAALNRVGLSAEARMIAAEAVARA